MPRGHSGKDPGAEEQPSIHDSRWNLGMLPFTRHLIAEGVGTGFSIRHHELGVSRESGPWLLLLQ